MSLGMPIHCLPALQGITSYLESYGCYTLQDALQIRDELSNSQVQRVLSNLSLGTWQRVLSASPLTSSTPALLKTYNASMDRALGGGIPLGSLVEIFGYAGVGKTQLALQLASTVQVPVSLGGLGGKVLYLVTESHFPTGRFKEIASATQSAWNKRRPHVNPDDNNSSNSLLDNVYVQKIESLTELIHKLEDYVSDKCKGPLENVRLLVVDSIAYHFRFQEEDKEEPSLSSTSKLFKIFNLLNRFALRKEAIVVLTNQMTSCLSEEESRDVPALGFNWSYSGSTKVHLDFHPKGERSIRSLQVVKCTYKDVDGGKVHYCITKDGVRDVSEALLEKTLRSISGRN